MCGTVLNSVGMCVCVCVCVNLTACVWTAQCGCTRSKEHSQCDHVLSGERYNSHGEAGIELNL